MSPRALRAVVGPDGVDIHRRRSLVWAGAGALVALGSVPGHAADADAAARAKRLAAVSQHFPFGIVSPPRRLSPWRVQTDSAQRTDLMSLLRGKTTAVQFMFTGCNASCPLQGALFAQSQQLLRAGSPAASGLQWLSLSVDALADSPQRLSAWLKKFSAHPGWVAAVPAVADVERIVAQFSAGGQGAMSHGDPHPGQVYLVNARAELVFRTPAMPLASEISQALREVAAGAY